VKSFHYIIVPTARKMYGHQTGSYPVRNMHELIAFVNKGVWDLRLPEGNKLKFALWKNEAFSVNDLANFCSPEGPHNEMFKALKSYKKTAGKKFYEIGYVLDAEILIENLKIRYRYTEEQPSRIDEILLENKSSTLTMS
jgi:hypothetical protein